MATEIGRTERNPFMKEAHTERTAEHEPSPGERAARLEEIRTYLRERQAGRPVVATTMTRGGQQLDWIPIESQTPDGKLASPPADDQLDLAERLAEMQDGGRRPVRLVSFELTRQLSARGPAGTVPVVRRDLSKIHPEGTLQDFLSKHSAATGQRQTGPGADLLLPAGNGTHQYAFTSQTVANFGSEGNINAWDPYTEQSDEFSLGQVALARGSEGGMQTVECGHQEYRNLYGDWVPHLFIFYTTNNYTASGNNIGGYNRDVDGWVQYSGTIYPGALSRPLSSFGGPQFVMPIKYQLYRDDWWLRINGQWIGYYPASLFSPAGLRNGADRVAWYGEVAEPAGRAATATTMGSGEFPSAGWQYAAFMSNLAYQSNAAGALSRYNGAAWASRPACYDVEAHFANSGSWQSYFWWGGPGRSRQCQ